MPQGKVALIDAYRRIQLRQSNIRPGATNLQASRPLAKEPNTSSSLEKGIALRVPREKPLKGWKECARKNVPSA
jgi:hypothetical protein